MGGGRNGRLLARLRRGRGGGVPIHLPVPPGSDITGLVQLQDEDTLVLCTPLTPSGNRWQRTHHRERSRWRRSLEGLLVPLIRHALSGRELIDPTWAERAELAVVRCSLAQVEADHDNVVAGLKATVDVLVGAGLLPDDKPAHLTWASVKDEPNGHWTWPGPATWLVLARTARPKRGTP